MKKKLLIFILTLALWFVLAGKVNIHVFLLGAIICSIISLMLADNVFSFVQKKHELKGFFKKIYYIFLLISSFIYDVFISAIRVSRHAFEMKPSLSSRTVRIKTSLENLNSNAALVNFITFTQGSIAMDFDHLNRYYFIHWIDVHGEDEVEVKKALISKHEHLIAKIFD
ncbi:Na+/H+ antiporter subunit E [Paraliobacillus quinghaiensis]|uniref:Na+/H+ antiporter subunit E n=1 Tax=Paraliobacillus quinghaiensis TaxID=470815 RepID=A0A917WYP1_9BACI|nr:Na+/H+ antiporter subunit E [Paraliobacillus quinghaiensis]GGM42288.1 Na+/H+ antiporter subunit E [Paraliobacillus quinghaiensis]